jgi:hypothetical protein
VTEGTRLLPLLNEEAQRAPDSISHLLDCNACQRDHDEDQRRDLGCGYIQQGYEERPEALWSHPAYPAALEYDRELAGGRKVSGRRMCAGWTSKLPWVGQLVQIRKHWERGSVRDRFGELPPIVWDWVEDLDVAVEVAQGYALKAKTQ